MIRVPTHRPPTHPGEMLLEEFLIPMQLSQRALAKTLQVPKATSAEGVRNNLEWLKRHHQEYRGQGVALNEGVLMGAHESMVELHKTLKFSDTPKSTVFINLRMGNAE